MAVAKTVLVLKRRRIFTLLLAPNWSHSRATTKAVYKITRDAEGVRLVSLFFPQLRAALGEF